MLPVEPFVDVSGILRSKLSWIPDTTGHRSIVLFKFLRTSHH
jgi:hypothetical protein